MAEPEARGRPGLLNGGTGGAGVSPAILGVTGKRGSGGVPRFPHSEKDSYMDYQTIIYEVKNHIAYITLNRPEVMNAISYQMTREIIDVGERVTSDPDVRAVILTGAGERAFCTGL